MLPSQKLFLWHGECFRLIVFKKQKTQAGLFEPVPLTAKRNLKDCPGWALSAEVSTKDGGQGWKTKVLCVSSCLQVAWQIFVLSSSCDLPSSPLQPHFCPFSFLQNSR